MTYAQHIQAAARYAAVVLTMPTPTWEQDVAAVRTLQDDTATLLAEMTRDITGLAPVEPLAVEVTDLARHPVRAMLNRLAALPGRTGYDEQAPSPTDRLTGRPEAPQAARTPVQAWQGLVIETAQARHILTPHARRMSDGQRWAALADVAALAETLATTRTDLPDPQRDSRLARRQHSHAAALAVEAREVTRLAGTPTSPVAAAWVTRRPAVGVVPVCDVAHLPPAAANLGRLLTTRQASITDLLAITGLLAQTSRASARALHAAARHDPGHGPVVLPAAAALERHADNLARAVTAERRHLAAVAGADAVVIAQGRQIGAFALPRLAHLARHPGRADAAATHVLAYLALAPALTRAVLAGVEHTTGAHRVAIRDRTNDDAPYTWRPATGADLARLTATLTAAAHAATPPPTAAPTLTRAGDPPAAAPLTAALEHRREQLRPARPSAAALSGRFAAVRRHGQYRPASWM